MAYPVLSVTLLFIIVGRISCQAELYLPVQCKTDADCFHTAYSVCDSEAGKCACERGFCPANGGYYCQRVKSGTPCTPVNGTGDGFCQSGVAGSICDINYAVCRCPDGTGNVFTEDGNSYCAKALTLPTCAKCIATGGVCLGNTSVAERCACPEFYTSSNPELSLETGCDRKEVPTHCACRPPPAGDVGCVDPHAQCLYNNDLSMNHFCKCELGFVAVPRGHEPVYADCREIINKVLDPLCETCEANGGTCYTMNENKTMDGCLCPKTRSSGSDKPIDACNVNHFEMDCKKTDPTICFRPYNNPYHHHLKDGLSVGTAALFIRKHQEDEPCHFVEGRDGFCMNISQARQHCGAEVEDTKDTMSSSAWVVLQYNVKYATARDLILHAYCRYDKFYHVSTTDVVIAQKQEVSNEGYSVKPVVIMTASDRLGDNAEITGVRLGEQMRLVITMTDDKGIYTSLRAEVCIVSDHVSLQMPETEAVPFIMNSCPEPSSFLSKGTTFYPMIGNLKALQTGLFTVPKFSRSEYIYFHCAIRVCINPDNCQPADCSGASRRKRSVLGSCLVDGHCPHHVMPASHYQLLSMRTKRSHTMNTPNSIYRSEDTLLDPTRALESPDFAQQTIGVKVYTDESHPPYDPYAKYERDGRIHEHHHPAYPQGFGEDFYYRPDWENEEAENIAVADDSSLTMWVTVASIAVSCVATIIAAALVFYFCFLQPKKKEAEKTQEAETDMS